MPASLALRAAALLGFLLAFGGGTAYVYRHLPRVYPREETALDARTYRVVRSGIAVGVAGGVLGTLVTLVDAVGTVRALGRAEPGLVAGLAILIPDRLGRGLIVVSVAVLLVAALLAAAVEYRNVRR